MSCDVILARCSACRSNFSSITNLVEVLALELGDDLLEAVTLSVDTDGGENGLDVGGGGGLVASKGEEEVGSEVLHFELTVPDFCQYHTPNYRSDATALLKAQQSAGSHRKDGNIPLLIKF